MLETLFVGRVRLQAATCARCQKLVRWHLGCAGSSIALCLPCADGLAAQLSALEEPAISTTRLDGVPESKVDAVCAGELDGGACRHCVTTPAGRAMRFASEILAEMGDDVPEDLRAHLAAGAIA